MKKLYALCLGLLCSFTSWGQTALSAGDVVILYMNPSGTDRFAFASLKAITAGTVISFTDNGFTSATAGRTGEGFVTFTAATNYTAGKVFTWVNGAALSAEFSSNNPSGFDLSATEDQLFAFQGPTANWASQSSVTLLFGIDTGSNTGFISTGSATATTSYLPAALTLGTNALQLTRPNGYFANGSAATSSVVLPANLTPSQVLALVVDPSKWYTSNSEITSAPTYSGALPVTYLNFQASYTAEKMVSVTWATASETSNSFFDIERSVDAISYATVGHIPGKGTTAARQNYTFTDEAPSPGWNYYRLRQVDQDGSASVSRAVAVLNENPIDNTLTIWPNPASADLRLSLAGGQTPQQVSVVELSGKRTMLSLTNGNILNVAELPAALYLLEVQTTTGQTLRQRLLKQ